LITSIKTILSFFLKSKGFETLKYIDFVNQYLKIILKFRIIILDWGLVSKTIFGEINY